MNAGLEGLMISEIACSANLSHRSVTANCQKLIDAAMIRSVKNGRTRVYIITEKGIRFFREFQEFQDTVKELNIRY
ncbi:MAG: transcriptional regulator [Thaumarchaeota archaeon]|nr:transcriptional regulator [Nitrososphaerota archaeon]